MQLVFYSDDQTGAGSGTDNSDTAADTTPLATPEQEHTSSSADDGWWQEAAEDDAADNSSAITTPLPHDLHASDLPPAKSITAEPPAITRDFAFAALRDIGQVRAINQDNVFGMIATVPRAGGNAPLGLFIVADGMGGHEGGEIASQMAVATVARSVMADLVVPALDEAMTEPLQSILVEAIQSANHAIWNAAQMAGTDMGTTCTTALVLGHTVYLGHVGDSRAYLIGESGVRQISNDHSAVGRLIQMGQLGPEAARDHPLRSHLYRTVGQTPEIGVDFESIPIGDARHLLLCSDGLWGLIEEAEIQTILAESRWPEEACQRLIAQANAAGGDDNISAIVVALP